MWNIHKTQTSWPLVMENFPIRLPWLKRGILECSISWFTARGNRVISIGVLTNKGSARVQLTKQRLMIKQANYYFIHHTHTHTNTQREWWFPTCNMVSQQMGVFSFLTEDLAGEESSRCSLICGVPLQNVQIMTIFGRLHDDTWCGSVIVACLFMPALCSVHDEGVRHVKQPISRYFFPPLWSDAHLSLEFTKPTLLARESIWYISVLGEYHQYITFKDQFRPVFFCLWQNFTIILLHSKSHESTTRIEGHKLTLFTSLPSPPGLG